jgi:anti-sigma B factor antagonist
MEASSRLAEGAPMLRDPQESGLSPDRPAAFRVDQMAGCVVLTAAGEIDVHSGVDFHHALDSATRLSPHVVIDLSAVTFIDSMGLGAIISARRRAVSGGGTILLVRPPAMARRLLAGTNLQQLLAVYESVDDAVRAVVAGGVV